MHINSISYKKLARGVKEAKCERESRLFENNPSSTFYEARVQEIQQLQQEINEIQQNYFINLRDLLAHLAEEKKQISTLNKLLQENVINQWKGNEHL